MNETSDRQWRIAKERIDDLLDNYEALSSNLLFRDSGKEGALIWRALRDRFERGERTAEFLREIQETK